VLQLFRITAKNWG